MGEPFFLRAPGHEAEGVAKSALGEGEETIGDTHGTQ